jgi:tRNA(Glu) U13 pseudouridine synthase TruD
LLSFLAPAGDSRRLVAAVKRSVEDFIVREPVPDYPGMGSAETAPPRYLSIGHESDMPALDTTADLWVTTKSGQRLRAVAMTVVKKGMSTWRMVDLLAKFLSQQLGRPVNHKQIYVSGLKDKKAITAQTVVVLGVSMAELSAVDWSWFHEGPPGMFVKDVRPTDRLLFQGDHLANAFEIVVRADGQSADELRQYIYPYAVRLQERGFWMPNCFERQRYGPTQNNQLWGKTLLTGEYEAPPGTNPFMSAVEALLFQMLFGTSESEAPEAVALKQDLQPYWQFNFEAIATALRQHRGRFNLGLEYEVAKRLADEKNFGRCAEAVLYDLKDRLSIALGAWQAFYWNWEVASQIKSKRARPGNRASLPLLLACEDAKRYYRHSHTGRQALREMAVCERLARSGEPYFYAAIDYYWSDPQLHGNDRPDNTGLSLQLVRKLFGFELLLPDRPRPDQRELSAALVKHLFLLPRHRESGELKPNAPRRRAFVRVSDFDFSCEDGAITLRFALRSGSYATMLLGLLFDTSDPDELPEDEGEERDS